MNLCRASLEERFSPPKQGLPAEAPNLRTPAPPTLVRLSLAPGVLVRVAIAAVVVLYAQTATFDFVYDDVPQILLNPWLQSWNWAPDYFTQHSWQFSALDEAKYYRPVYLLWLRANYALFGGIPGWWHLSAMLAHMAMTLLVYTLSERVLQNPGAAAVASLIFGLHPANVEAVAWISGTTEVIHGIFLVAAFLLYLRWRERGKARWLAACAVSYSLALFTKESAVILPFLVLGYEWLSRPAARDRCWGRRLGVALVTLAVLTAGYLVARLAVLGSMGEVEHPPLAAMLLTYPLVAWFYLGALLAPWERGLYHDFRLAEVSAAGIGTALLAAAALVALAAVVGRLSTPLRFALLWSTLTIALPLLAVGTLQVHDRYLYLPTIGLGMVLGVAATNLPRLLPASKAAGVQFATVLAIAAALGLISFFQVRTWKDDTTVFTHAHQQAPRNLRARQLLAHAYLARGESDAGFRLLKGALIMDPEAYRIHFDLGVLYYRRGEYAAAKEHLGRVAGSTQAPRKIRAASYSYLAAICQEEERLNEAETLLRRAVAFDPQSTQYQRALRAILEAIGKSKRDRLR
ncbi:MAG: glycosyltransferase family 39 protein [Acidobacteria bacterium]|nr:glycosyltransferase family 39 protein [Acidobacteriota bacterium]